MSKKQWMVLLMLFLTYLLLGASIFYHIESRLETERVEKAKRERIEINALLHAHYVPSHNHDHGEILGKLTRYCGKSVYNYTEDEVDRPKWDFYNSFYFAYTVVSTIGYGNLAPTNMLGRILMIFYGLIGIPINGILLTQLGEFFGRAFVKAHEKYKSYNRGRNDQHRPKKLTSTFETGKVGLAAQIFAYLTPGFVMFIFFPAFLFSHYEGWNYDEAVYYAFVTLTTIGFGDYVAGQDNSKGSGFFFVLYKIFLICWISFGLGYVFMIMTFIAQGMRSKKIARLEHKLAINLKHTQSKIWNEFNKEMNYLRRVFNELQLSKVKRVYVDECNYQAAVRAKLLRSTSFPDLRDLSYGGRRRKNGKKDEDDEEEEEEEEEEEDDNGGFVRYRPPPRRRANSEVVGTKQEQIARVVSETDLQRIDKTATFATHAMVQPAELLARLVDILGYMPPATEDAVGGDVYSTETPVAEEQRQEDRRNRMEGVDAAAAAAPAPAPAATTANRDRRYSSGIKSSTQTRRQSFGSGSWTIGGDDRTLRFPRRFRSRATSEIKLYDSKRSGGDEYRNVEWTWSGPVASKKIQELTKTRTSSEGESPVKDRGGVKLSKFYKALTSSGPWRHRFSTGSVKKGAEEEMERGETAATTTHRRANDDGRDSTNSTFDGRRYYYTHTGGIQNLVVEGGGGGEGSGKGNGNLLEETSLADFLRALTLLHATVAGNSGNSGNSWTAGVGATAGSDAYVARIGQPRRKMGIASLTPPKLPSLFTLFSSPPSGSTTRTNDDGDDRGNNTARRTSEDRRKLLVERKKKRGEKEARRNSSSAFVVAATTTETTFRKPRRFSLRPVATPVSPPTPPRSCSPFMSDARRLSSLESSKKPPPPIRTEGELNVSSPTNKDGRRLSLRSIAVVRRNHEDNVRSGVALKGLHRWKAAVTGTAQRQIGQVHVQRRVRAFSLNDVHRTEEPYDDATTSRSRRRDAAVAALLFQDSIVSNVRFKDERGDGGGVRTKESASHRPNGDAKRRTLSENVSIVAVDARNEKEGGGEKKWDWAQS